VVYEWKSVCFASVLLPSQEYMASLLGY